MLELAPFVHEYLVRSDLNAVKFDKSGNLGEAIKNKNLVLPPQDTEQTIKNTVGLACFDDKMRSTKSELTKEAIEKNIRLKATAQNFIDSIPVVNDVEANAFIQKICDHLAQIYQLPKEFGPRCRIQASLAPNAFAVPGGDISVSAGLLGTISDLDGLIFVLAHEIGHVVAQHSIKRVGINDTANKGLAALGLLGTLASLGASGATMGGMNLVSWFPKYVASSQLKNFGMQTVGFATAAGLMKYSRENEKEADHLGHEVALAAGARQEALEASWEEFSQWSTNYHKRDASLIKKIMASHPSDKSRFENIEKRSDLFKDLKPYCDGGEKSNRLDPSFYKSYSAIHEKWKPEATRFGEALKGTSQTTKPNENSNKNYSYFKAVTASVASQCFGHMAGLDQH